VLRRTRRAAPPRAATLEFGLLRIDVTTREVHLEGTVVDFTAKEFDLLAYLARSPRQVFSRDQLLAQVWESSSDWQDSATVTEHVRRIRRKIEADPDNPRWITTVRGVGYRFEP
jgi:two-component system, OmpR family, phosphate regulon response regulator PhoB